MRSRVVDLFIFAFIPLMLLLAWSVSQSRMDELQGAASATPATQPAAPRVPVTFARSGREVRVQVPQLPLLSEAMALRAYGRIWVKAVAQNQKSVVSAEFLAPEVRVPTVFSVAPVNRAEFVFAEVVVYPDRDVEWDKEITLYSCGAPEWFNQWAAATGLPVKQIALADLASAKLAPADEKAKSLLILGSAAAGKDLADVTKLAGDQKVNVLVLDADWFGDAAGPVSIAPAQMLGGLAQMAKQNWPQPLTFTSHRQPWGGIANRWAWIVDEHGLPLVEQAAYAPEGMFAGDPLPVLCSYLPWATLLGREEIADQTFLEMLKAGARVTPRSPMMALGRVWPEKFNASQRPVLATAMKGQDRRLGGVFILDIRGDGFPPDDEWNSGQSWELRDLLILGDDKKLDESKWLKLDRAKKTSKREGVVWLSDDELPASRDNQIRLMLKLTELGVPLATPEPEKAKGVNR